jgi:hypothetical protein
MTDEQNIEETQMIAEEIMSLYDQLENINSSLVDIAKSLRMLSKRPDLEQEPIEQFEQDDEE